MLYIGGAISSGSIHNSRVRSRSPRDIRRLPSANRPSINQASAIMTAPVVVIVNDTVWMRDGRLSSRTPNVGSWTTGLAPAPRAPIAIRTVPVAPNRRVRCKRGELGSVQRRAHRLLIAVQAGDRRAQRVVAGCHQSSVAACQERPRVVLGCE